MDNLRSFFDPFSHELRSNLKDCKLEIVDSGIEVTTTLEELIKAGIFPNILTSYEATNPTALTNPSSIACKIVVLAHLRDNDLQCDISLFIGELKKPYYHTQKHYDISLACTTLHGQSVDAGLSVHAMELFSEMKDKRCFTF